MQTTSRRRQRERGAARHRRPSTALVVALVVLTACDPLSAGLASLGANATAGTLVDGLQKAIDHLDQAIHDHRAGIKADVLEVVASTREQLERLLGETRAVASALEDKVAADLAGDIGTVLNGAEVLTRAIEATANDTIRNAAEGLRGTIDKVQNGPLREAKATARLVLAKGERTAQGIIVSAVDGLTLLAIRIGGGLLLLAGAIGLVVAAIKRSSLGIAVGAGLAVLGAALLVLAPWVARIGAKKQTVPDPEASCEVALREGARLDQALAPVVQARAEQLGTKPPSAGDAPGLLRAIRGGHELRLRDLVAPASAVAAPATTGPGVAAVAPATSAVAAVPTRAGARLDVARISTPLIAPGVQGPPLQVRPWFARPESTVARSASTSSDPLFLAASAVREHGPICIAYSMSPQKADACERYLNEALAYLGVAVVCTSAAQCPQGEWCDEHSAACMALGTYCQRPDHCGAGKECDTSLNRCVAEAGFTCSGAAPCRPGQLCSSGRCRDETQLVGQPCSDLTKQGPCAQGRLLSDGHGGVVCRSVVSATTEVCDGIDNNCNGTVDEGLDGAACAAQALGSCVSGRRACRGGTFACEPGQPAPERCNGTDENCNGVVDDDPRCSPQEMTGGTIACGWNAAANATIGAECPGFARESCFPTSGPQDPGNVGHAEFVGWTSNRPDDCRCDVHCGTTWRTTGERWQFKVTARRRD